MGFLIGVTFKLLIGIVTFVLLIMVEIGLDWIISKVPYKVRDVLMTIILILILILLGVTLVCLMYAIGDTLWKLIEGKAII